MALRFDGRIVNSSDLYKYDPILACDGDRIAVVPDPINNGRYVVRFVRKITDTPVLSGYRAEICALAYKRMPPFEEWYEWECLLLSSQHDDNFPYVFYFLQIHDDWSSGGAPHLPPIILGVYHDSLYVLAHSSAVQNPALPSDIEEIKAVSDVGIIYDKWARIVVRAKYSTDGNGELDIWYGGMRVCALRNVHIGYPGNSVFVETGAYTGLAQLREPVVVKSVYSTGVRIFDETTTHAEMGVSDEIPMCSSGKFRQ